MEEQNLQGITDDIRIIQKFITLLSTSGFAVRHIEGLRFEIWVRGMPKEHARIVFSIELEPPPRVEIYEAEGEYTRFKSKKYKGFFENNMLSLYMRAVTEIK